MSGRCKACDCKLKDTEILWRQDIKQFEELCLQCRMAIYIKDSERLDIESLGLDVTIDRYSVADNDDDGGDNY